MAYYKAKYGEDFKPSAEMLKQSSGSGTKSGKKSGNRTKGNQQSKGGYPRNQNENVKKNTPKQAPAADKAKQEPQKKGFLSKLFGKKNK
jgi:hypothetical protein